MGARYYGGGGGYRPDVLPQVGWSEQPGEQIAQALENYQSNRRAQAESDVRVAGEKQRQARAAVLDPIEEALKLNEARRAGIVPNDDSDPQDSAAPAKPRPFSAGVDPDEVARMLHPEYDLPASGAPAQAPVTTPTASVPMGESEPDPDRPAYAGMPGAFHPGLNDFVPSLPDVGPREVAGHMAAGLLRAPVEAATGRQGPTNQQPTGAPAPAAAAPARRRLGNTGYAYDASAAASYRQPIVQDLERAGVEPGTADVLARDPESIAHYLETTGAPKYTGRLTDRDLAQMSLREELERQRDETRERVALEQGHSRVQVALVHANAGQNARAVAPLQREEAAAARDVQILEGSQSYPVYRSAPTLDSASGQVRGGPASVPEFAQRYRGALARWRSAQSAVQAALGGGQTGSEAGGANRQPGAAGGGAQGAGAPQLGSLTQDGRRVISSSERDGLRQIGISDADIGRRFVVAGSPVGPR